MRPLSLALRSLVAAQRVAPPLGDAVRHAVRLRLSPAEAEAERAIDRLRASLAASTATVEVVDYGAGADRPPVRRVADLYARASSPPSWGRLLFGLARALRPVRVLELGANLGVSAAHVAAAIALNEAEDRTDDEPDGFAGGRPAPRLTTLEGAPALAALAARHLAALGHAGRSRVVTGAFDATLADVCAADGPFDLVFVDGHHEEAAALRYVEALRPHLAPGAVVVLDDVEPGRPVRRAWTRLRRDHPDAPAAYLGKWGLMVMDGGRWAMDGGTDSRAPDASPRRSSLVAPPAAGDPVAGDAGDRPSAPLAGADTPDVRPTASPAPSP